MQPQCHLLLINVIQYLSIISLVPQWVLADLLTIDGPSYFGLTLAQVLKKDGFESRVYEVVSDSGYITTATRIINPNRLSVANSTSAPTVVIHHGILSNAVSPQMGLCTNSNQTSQFLMHSNNSSDDLNAIFNSSAPSSRSERQSSTPQCLMYHLSNNNYDVWLLEARGTSPATLKHTNKSITYYDYWNFNVEDQALEDVPAQIAKVKEISGKQKVAFIGYSLSTSYLFILLSERPEFMNNLTAAICVAPVALSNHARGLAAMLGEIVPVLGKFLNPVNGPFAAPFKLNLAINGLVSVVCELRLVATTLCRGVINYLFGPDIDQNILTARLFGHLPSPTSFKTVLQVSQWGENAVSFTRFDYYDAEINRRHYGQPTPPQYNLTNINTDRLILVRSTGNDYLSNEADQEELISRLQRPLYKDIVVPSSYNHFSFWIAPSSFAEFVEPIKSALDEIYKDIDQSS